MFVAVYWWRVHAAKEKQFPWHGAAEKI